MKHNNLFGLPPFAINAISVGVVFFIACLGVKTIKAPNLALKVANTQLVTSSSASKLENLAQQLQEQAELIEQKDAKYQELEDTYQDYLRNGKGDIELGMAIEAIDDLPEVENIQQIQVEIEETENVLSELEP